LQLIKRLPNDIREDVMFCRCPFLTWSL